MPSKYQNNTVKVPESVIAEIRKLGMAAAIKKAKGGGASKEFVEGVRRFYPAAVKGEDGIDSKTSNRATSGKGVKTESKAPESPPIPASKPTNSAAVKRRLERNLGGRNRPTSNRSTPNVTQEQKRAALARQNARPSRAESFAKGVNPALRDFQKGGKELFEDKINPALRSFQKAGKEALIGNTRKGREDKKKEKSTADRPLEKSAAARRLERLNKARKAGLR